RSPCYWIETPVPLTVVFSTVLVPFQLLENHVLPFLLLITVTPILSGVVGLVDPPSNMVTCSVAPPSMLMMLLGLVMSWIVLLLLKEQVWLTRSTWKTEMAVLVIL